jgi:hypothetical protein
VLHQVGVSFDLYYDARKHKIKSCDLKLLTQAYLKTQTILLYARNFVFNVPDLINKDERSKCSGIE